MDKSTHFNEAILKASNCNLFRLRRREDRGCESILRGIIILLVLQLRFDQSNVIRKTEWLNRHSDNGFLHPFVECARCQLKIDQKHDLIYMFYPAERQFV